MDKFKDWLAHPYNDDMSAADWFLFFGLMIAISVGWSFILRSIKEAAT